MKLVFACLALVSIFCIPNYAQPDSALTVKIVSPDLNTDNDISLDSLLNIKISSASKYLETSREAPSSVSIITAEEIEKYGYASFPEILNSVRGFYISYDRNYNYLGVRGFGRPTDYNDRIHLTINGLSVNDYYYGQATIGTDLALPVSCIERIEIIRGPGSILYGNNAMFAVINIVTKNPGYVTHANTNVQFGSDGKRLASVNYNGMIGSEVKVAFSGMVSDNAGRDIYYHEYDTDSTNHGVAKNCDFDRSRGVLANVFYKQFSFQGMYMYRNKGIPTASYGMIFNDSRARTVDQSGSLELKYTGEISSTAMFTTRAYLNHCGYSGYYPYSNFVTDNNNINWIGTELLYQWDISTSNRFVSGIEFKKILDDEYASSNETGRDTYNNITFHTWSMYVQDEFQVTNNIICNFGVRFDEQSNIKGTISPRLAAIYTPQPETSIKLIYGQAFRYPNSYELYYYDTLSRFKLSSGLKNEQITTSELVCEHKFGSSLYGIVSAYNNKVNNLIDQDSDMSDTTVHFINRGGISTWGADIELDGFASKGLSGFLKYSYQYTVNRDTKEKLTNSPSHVVNYGISFALARDYRLSFDGSYESERLTLKGAKTPKIALVNMNLVGKYFSNKLRVSLRINNLFNKTYFYPGGYEHVQDIIAQDPRTYNLKFSYDF